MTGKQIAINTITQVLGKFIQAILGIITIKLISNYLGVEQYGYYSIVFEWLGFFGIAADFGLFNIGTREVVKNKEKEEQIIGNILLFRTILAFFVLGSGTLIAFFIPKYDSVEWAIFITAISMLFAFVGGSMTIVLQTRMKMYYTAIILSLSRVISTIIAILIIINKLDFIYLFISGFIGNLFVLIIDYTIVSKYIKVRFHFDTIFLKELFFRALPYGLALVLATLYFKIDSIMLFQIKGAKEVGIYSVAMKIVDVLSVISVFFLNSMTVLFTKTWHENKERCRYIIQRAFDTLAYVGLPLGLGIAILSKEAILIISNQDFLYGTKAVQILMLAMIFSFLNAVFGYFIVAIEKQKYMLYINASTLTLNIILNFIFIPKYGFIGASWTSVVSEVIVFVLTYLAVYKESNIKINFISLSKILLLCFVLSIPAYHLKDHFYGVFSIVISIIIYFVGSVFFKFIKFKGKLPYLNI